MTEKFGNRELTNEDFIKHLRSELVINEVGDKFYYFGNKLHNLEGPAVEYVDGSKEWWINDCLFSEEDFNSMVELINYYRRKDR